MPLPDNDKAPDLTMHVLSIRDEGKRVIVSCYGRSSSFTEENREDLDDVSIKSTARL